MDMNSFSESFGSGQQDNVVPSNKTRILMNKYWGDIQTAEISESNSVLYFNIEIFKAVIEVSNQGTHSLLF